MNISCVICSDIFLPSDSIFTTPCGHLFHHACLIQWLERKKDCPQCRQKCTERNIFRIYFNTNANLDSSSVNSANLIETVDNLTLQVREKEMALKNSETKQLKIADELKQKESKIKKLDSNVSEMKQVVSIMRHEIDLFKRDRSSYQVLETENKSMKEKIELLQTVESVLTASQKEIDDVLKQNLSTKDLSVMVGTLRRELNSNESRKHELRKQLQCFKNDLRVEQEEKKILQDKLSTYESENHTLINRLKRLNSNHDSESMDLDNSESMDLDTSAEASKKPRLALQMLDDQNTPSPLSREDLKRRIDKIHLSDSPYLKIKSSSIALACIMKKPGIIQSQPKVPSDVQKLSIFNKPRLLTEKTIPTLKSDKDHMVYNGLGGTTKVLQSDLKNVTLLGSNGSNKLKTNFRKKLSASALNK